MKIINIAVSILIAANVATAQPTNLPEPPVTCEDDGIETCQGENSCFDACGEEDSIVKAPCQVSCAMHSNKKDVTRCTIKRGNSIKYECRNPPKDEVEEADVVVATERTANVVTAQQPENLPEPPDTCADDGIETCQGEENSCFAACGTTVPLPCSVRCNGTPPANGEPTNGVLSCTIKTKGDIKYQCFNPRDNEIEMDEVVVTTERSADDEEPEILTKSMIGLEEQSCDDYGIKTCKGDGTSSCFGECGEKDSIVERPCQVSCAMHSNGQDVTRCTIKRGNDIKFQCFNGGDDEIVVHTESAAAEEEKKTLSKSMLGLLRGISKN